MRTRYIILLAATCLSPAALAQRGGGPLGPAYLASVSITASRTLVAADGDCWIRFDMTARNNQGNPYSGAAISLEISHSNDWVTIRNFQTTGSTTTTDASGNAKLWASSFGGDPSLGFRAVATGGGRTVWSSYTYVVFSAGDWTKTPGSVLSGSGNWTLTTSNGGTATAKFCVNLTELATTNEGVTCDGATYIEEYCELSASRVVSGQAEASATASGSGSGDAYHNVTWSPAGVPPDVRFGAPPGFSFKESAAQSVQVEHWGIGHCTGVGGPITGGTTRTATDNAGIIETSTSPVYGATVPFVSGTVKAMVTLHSSVEATATPGPYATASGNAKGRNEVNACETVHNPVLEGYPAP